MNINVFEFQIKNGKHYDSIPINETINKTQLPGLWAKYRKKVGSIKTERNGKFFFDPDIVFAWVELPEKVQEKQSEMVHEQFKPTTKSINELIRLRSLAL